MTYLKNGARYGGYIFVANAIHDNLREHRLLKLEELLVSLSYDTMFSWHASRARELEI